MTMSFSYLGCSGTTGASTGTPVPFSLAKNVSHWPVMNHEHKYVLTTEYAYPNRTSRLEFLRAIQYQSMPSLEPSRSYPRN